MKKFDTVPTDGILVPVEELKNTLASAGSTRLSLELYARPALSGVERMRKLGPGIRRYGFIEQVVDIAQTNLEFAPEFFSIVEMRALVDQLNLHIGIDGELRRALRMNADMQLATSDAAYQLALMYYNSVKWLVRRGVPGADVVFGLLRPYFEPFGRRHGEGAPTQKQLERDVRALLHNKKEGAVVVKNTADRVVKGEHVVVDEVHN